MKALIVYDSFFGNTEKIAITIGKAFKEEQNSGAYRVNDIQPELIDNIDLLILGSPTRKFQATPAIKTFISKIPRDKLKDVQVSSFDTRVDEKDIKASFLRFLIRTFGYAAEPLAKKLTKKGGNLIIKPEGFFVKDTEGPLKDGELERAEEWGKQIKKKINN